MAMAEPATSDLLPTMASSIMIQRAKRWNWWVDNPALLGPDAYGHNAKSDGQKLYR
jgi:hypothetical protein